MSPPADAITISEPVLFDFDGDGVPEIFLRSSVEGNEGHREAEPYLLAFHGGVVVRFYRGDVEQLEDVNGDGRPDLVRHSYTEETSGEAGFTRWMQGPREVLLSKPDGSFEPLGEGADGG
jgi:hypothetical protein